jgi:hypothetical protein
VGTSRITLNHAGGAIFYSFALTKGRTADEYDFDNMVVQDLRDSLRVFRIRHKPTPSWVLLENTDAPFEGDIVLLDWDGNELEPYTDTGNGRTTNVGSPCYSASVAFDEHLLALIVTFTQVNCDQPAVTQIAASSDGSDGGGGQSSDPSSQPSDLSGDAPASGSDFGSLYAWMLNWNSDLSGSDYGDGSSGGGGAGGGGSGGDNSGGGDDPDGSGNNDPATGFTDPDTGFNNDPPSRAPLTPKQRVEEELKELANEKVVVSGVRLPDFTSQDDDGFQATILRDVVDFAGLTDLDEISKWEEEFGNDHGLRTITYLSAEDKTPEPGSEGGIYVSNCPPCNKADAEYEKEDWINPDTGEPYFDIKKSIRFVVEQDGSTSVEIKIKTRPGLLTEDETVFTEGKSELEKLEIERDILKLMKENIAELVKETNSLAKAKLNPDGTPKYDVNGAPEMEIKTADDKDISLFQKAQGFLTLGIDAVKTGKLSTAIYDDRTDNKDRYDRSPINGPPAVGGMIDVGVEIVRGPADLVNAVSDLFKPGVVDSMLKSLRELFQDGGMERIALSILEGFAGPIDKIVNGDHVESQYGIGKMVGRVLEMFIPDPLGNLGKIITKGMGKLKALSKPLREKIGGTFGKSNKPNRSGNKADFDPDKHKLNKAQLQKLNDDLADNKALKDAMDGKPELVDAWKKLDDLGDDIPAGFRKDADVVKNFKKVVDNPDLNKHVFDGDVKIIGTNQAGKPIYKVTGVHSKKAFDGGKMRIKEGTKSPPNSKGYYEAKVEAKIDGFQNHIGEPWKVKTDKSTFFPDSWSPAKIQAEIAKGLSNKVKKFDMSEGRELFEGTLSDGTKLGIIKKGDKVETVFPKLD